jgi:hypothetical protein
MRFPRISRIRWDKPAAEADRLETWEALVERPAAGCCGGVGGEGKRRYAKDRHAALPLCDLKARC